MKVHNQLMIRVPQFPFDANLNDVWNELLDSIQYASPEFYQKVSHLTPEAIYSQPPKIINTILKYFNRAKFRCTPLGTFASYGIVDININKSTNLLLKNLRTIHVFPDWKYSEQVGYEFKDVLNKNLKLIANSTYYQVSDAIRYIRRKENSESFELAEVLATAEILLILKSLKSPIPITSLAEQLEGLMEPQQLFRLVEAMILANLVLTEFDPNIIGADYFNRIDKFNYEFPIPYILSELCFKQGNVCGQFFKHLPALVKLLTNFLPQKTNALHLTEFIARYTKKFDRQHISVMEAIDPQVGVGYGSLHKEQHNNPIIDKLLSQNDSDQSVEDGEFLSEFLKSRLSFKVGETIDFSQLPELRKNREVKNKLPNTFSVIGSIANGSFLLDRIGGHSANQLAGRFSLCGSKAFHYTKELTKIEESANPEIVFFDIAYHAELTVDNINRRPRLYQQELPLVCYPGIEQPLTLDDLFISVSGDSIILRSQRLGKRVIPRMASAYNYRRSQLPVFRFLYDLAFYNVWPEISFDIKQIMPGLKYYPKVTFRNITLSMPKLVINKRDYLKKTNLDISKEIKQLLKQYGFGSLIKVLKGEEHTVFNLHDPVEMDIFISELKHKDEITVEELILDHDALVKDENGSSYINQVIIPLTHDEEIYPGSAPVIHDTLSTDRIYLPLADWIYWDIFVHPLHGDRILLEPIARLISLFDKKVKKWFFIRYNEHGEHLRLRIRAEKQYLSEIVDEFNKKIKPYFDAGLVHDLKINTYSRELERYDVVGIENIEAHFHQSSELVTHLLNQNSPDIEKYEHCLRIFIGVSRANIIAVKRFRDWTAFIKTTLEKEHNLNKDAFKAMNKYIKSELNYNCENTTAEQLFIDSLVKLLERCPQRRQAPLFTDLMHMHINRLFAEHQRTHELISYNLLHTVLYKEMNVINKACHAPGLS